MSQRCLSCDVLMMATRADEYCVTCRADITAYWNGGEKLPPRPKGGGLVVIDTWEGRRGWTHYRERSLCFGRRKPRVYVRPK